MRTPSLASRGEVAVNAGSVAVEDGGGEDVAFGTGYVLYVVGEVEEYPQVLGVEAAAVGEDTVGADDLVDAAGMEGGVFAAQLQQAVVEVEHGPGETGFRRLRWSARSRR